MKTWLHFDFKVATIYCLQLHMATSCHSQPHVWLQVATIFRVATIGLQVTFLHVATSCHSLPHVWLQLGALLRVLQGPQFTFAATFGNFGIQCNCEYNVFVSHPL